ncbi:putative hydrophobic seed protein [Helianthus debilis subsp. tardiflorus]
MALKSTASFLTLNILFFALLSSDPVSAQATCPRNGFQLGACAGVLNNFLGSVQLGTPPTEPCCSIFFGLANFEAAVCLCNSVKTSFLGVNFDTLLPSLNFVLNSCAKEVPSGFEWGKC